MRLPPLDDSDLAMRSFGPSDMILVGSPALVAAYGQPQALTDLARMPTLSTGPLGREHTWHFVDGESRPYELVHNPRLSADDFYTVRSAALRGLGVARLPALLSRDDLSSGALVRLLPSLSSRSGVVQRSVPIKARDGSRSPLAARYPFGGLRRQSVVRGRLLKPSSLTGSFGGTAGCAGGDGSY